MVFLEIWALLLKANDDHTDWYLSCSDRSSFPCQDSKDHASAPPLGDCSRPNGFRMRTDCGGRDARLFKTYIRPASTPTGNTNQFKCPELLTNSIMHFAWISLFYLALPLLSSAAPTFSGPAGES